MLIKTDVPLSLNLLLLLEMKQSISLLSLMVLSVWLEALVLCFTVSFISALVFCNLELECWIWIWYRHHLIHIDSEDDITTGLSGLLIHDVEVILDSATNAWYFTRVLQVQNKINTVKSTHGIPDLAIRGT